MLQGHDTMLIDRPLRVLVVDDHAGIRLGISRLIDAEAPRMCSVGAVGTVRQALAQTRALRPDVVVLDINLDGEDGLALIPALQGVTPCAVVVLTSLLDPRVAERAIQLGAQACVHKSAPADDLIACIAASRPGIAPISNPLSKGGDVSRSKQE
jgi:two-component system nitrate/nitrite response regulator NarL